MVNHFWGLIFTLKSFSNFYIPAVNDLCDACGFVLDWLPCCLIERPAPKPHLNASTYVGGSWAPPKSFNLSSNMSEYALDQDIPCGSCSLDMPENGGCGSCA